MTTFHSRQSDWRRRVRKKTNASTLQIHVTNCPTKLRGHVHEARKIQCNNVSNVVQKHGCKYCFYAKQALPLSFVRFLRLANGSSKNRRSPARRSPNGCESSGNTSGEMSRPFPYICGAVANAMPPNVRVATCKTTRKMAHNWHEMLSSQSTQQPMQHPAKHLERWLLGISSSRFQT